MGWTRLCGTLPFHPKIIEAGNEAVGAWCRMLSYAGEHLTSGKVSTAIALAITTQPVLDRLVDVRLLERDPGGGYVLHDFGDYNPTGPQLEHHRAELRAKRAAAGRRGAAMRWQRRSKRDGNLPSYSDGKPDGTDMAPSPSPSPSPNHPSGDVGSAPRKRARPKYTPEEVKAKEAVVHAFAAAVFNKKGVEPKLSHPGEHSAAFALSKTYGADEACSIITRALEDRFVLTSNTTLRYIASKAETWRGNAPLPLRLGKNAPQGGEDVWDVPNEATVHAA